MFRHVVFFFIILLTHTTLCKCVIFEKINYGILKLETLSSFDCSNDLYRMCMLFFYTRSYDIYRSANTVTAASRFPQSLGPPWRWSTFLTFLRGFFTIWTLECWCILTPNFRNCRAPQLSLSNNIVLSRSQGSSGSKEQKIFFYLIYHYLLLHYFNLVILNKKGSFIETVLNLYWNVDLRLGN